MKIVISPAKSLNFEKELPTTTFSEPQFLKQATTIQRTLKKKKRADNLGTRLLETCNVSRFNGFSTTEATDKVRKNATKEKISIVCQKINQRNGRFLGINIIEIKRDKIKDEYTFRYNIDYEKKLYKRELFVTINADNKVSAISTKEVPSKPM